MRHAVAALLDEKQPESLSDCPENAPVPDALVCCLYATAPFVCADDLRRGLDILQKIRKESRMKVEITEVDFEDIAEVDSKLLQLAQEVGGKIITNDFNLNKVAQLRGVPVLNINALSNAVKPVAIPGDVMTVQIVRPGKEHGQGLAYLDDGTMIVVDGGFHCMNEIVSVEVTSALQTAAGRMIFAKVTR